MAKSVQDQIRAILEEYGQEVQEVVNKAAIETAKETVKDLKQTSPKSKRAGKHYANNWAMKEKKIPAGGINTVVYNKAPTYRLTHLLEKGHVIRNRKGGPDLGRVAGDGIIAQVADEVAGEFEGRFQR